MDARSTLAACIENRSRACNLELRGADLAGAVLVGLSADGLDLSASDLRNASLMAARMSLCRLTGANLSGIDASGATLRQCILDRADARGACLDAARFEDCSARAVDFSGASMRAARLSETSFERALLRDVVLDDAQGEGVELRGADLRGATLVGARLDDADFRGADLRGADLSGGRFHGSDFRGAILEGTRFNDADCTGSWFDEGAGPYAEISAKVRNKEKSANTSLDDIAVAALRNALASMPEAFAARDGAIGELLARMQIAVEKLNSKASASAGEQKAWLESLMNIKNDGQALDVKALVDALSKGTGGLRDLLAKKESPVAEILDRMQGLVDTLSAASDQPPEEWKAWLEPLMKMTNEGRPIEGKALLDALAAFAQTWRPQADDPRSPAPSERKDQQQEH
jgi:uncharacterized protein YjbI with pentapeptide repeats